MKKILFISIILIAGFVVLSNCKTYDNSSPIALSGQVLINGIDMKSDYTNSSVDYNTGDTMTFKGQFEDPDGNDTIRKAVVKYSFNMGMMNHSGEITMWDDGTHGDHNPGDGSYHMEDSMENMMGLMGINWGDMMGNYEFEFYCYDEDGNESNHIMVNMNIH